MGERSLSGAFLPYQIFWNERSMSARFGPFARHRRNVRSCPLRSFPWHGCRFEFRPIATHSNASCNVRFTSTFAVPEHPLQGQESAHRTRSGWLGGMSVVGGVPSPSSVRSRTAVISLIPCLQASPRRRAIRRGCAKNKCLDHTLMRQVHGCHCAPEQHGKMPPSH